MAYCMVIATCGSETAAEALAAKIVRQKLAACVQMSPVTSVYTWKGKTETDAEVRLVMKTRTELYPKLEAFITAHHDYEVPQIVQVPVTDGLDAYLGWIRENTGA